MADILVGMIDWFVVMTDDSSVSLSVSPPGRSAWQAVIPWDSVIRVCFEAAGFLASDDLYIFTSLRPESLLIPTEADGGQELLRELIRRGLFDASLAITAAQAHEGIFCWPPLDEPGTDIGD
jgi:hypothetical protein